MAFAIFVVNMAESVGRGGIPGILSIIAAGILLSNVRAAFLALASEWKPPAEGENRPTRFSESFADKLVDQWPLRILPIMKVPFFIADALLLILVFAGFAVESFIMTPNRDEPFPAPVPGVPDPYIPHFLIPFTRSPPPFDPFFRTPI